MEKAKNIQPTTKLRIQQFDPETRGLVSDRLVEMSTEFRNGPTEKWNGPIGLDCVVSSKEDVLSLINYLGRLGGELPIEKVDKKTSPKKLDKMLSEKEPVKDLLKTAEAKCKTQEQLINYLREYNFMFVASDIIQDLATPEMLTLRDKDIEGKYQYMVRRVKEAKEPANDKYDFRLVFAIKVIGERVDIVPVYLWGKWEKTLKLKWEDKKKHNFKKVEKIYIFPEFMDYADRKRWRSEHRKVLKAKETETKFETSKFYNKHTPYIKVH